MKRFLLLPLGFGLVFNMLSAQETKKEQKSFNKWSVEGGVGLTKVLNFNNGSVDYPAIDLGVRFMPDNLFGLKANFGFNRYTDGDEDIIDFTTKQYRLDLQGVMNLGRMMRLENWTNTFNLLAHAGGGIGFLDYKQIDDKDLVGNLMAGMTLQTKLSSRVVFNVDATLLTNVRQNRSFSGAEQNSANKYGLGLNATAGLSIYLGKHKTHADWYSARQDREDHLAARIAALEAQMGNYAKRPEVTTVSNNVDNLGRRVDALEQRPAPKGSRYDDFVKDLISGYANIYFDVNNSTITAESKTVLGFVEEYMRKNPGVSIQALGYADETGPEDFNLNLSQDRAQSAIKVLSDAGIAASRLKATGKGVFAGIDQPSPQTKALARRASFIVN